MTSKRAGKLRIFADPAEQAALFWNGPRSTWGDDDAKVKTTAKLPWCLCTQQDPGERQNMNVYKDMQHLF